MNKFTKVAFKFLDLIVIFVMTFGSPMSVMAQDTVPFLTTDKTEYMTGDIVHVTGAAFTPGGYILAAKSLDGAVVNWADITASETGYVAFDLLPLDLREVTRSALMHPAGLVTGAKRQLPLSVLV